MEKEVYAVTFIDALRNALKNYANFSGRARRSEYWYLVLFFALISLLCVVPELIPLVELFWLAAMIPLMACAVRRLHDTGRSGLYLLLALLPVAGTIVLIIWYCQDGEPDVNRYGPSPKLSRGREVPIAVPVQLYVQCLSGPLQGQVYPVRNGLVFGRNQRCNVRMPDGTPGLSGMHCALRATRDGATLEDLNSTHGTFFADGRRLPPNYPEPIAAGMQFYLGSPQLLFRLVSQ